MAEWFPTVRVVTGDVLDAASVERAVQGQDAVVCALGATRHDGSTQLSPTPIDDSRIRRRTPCRSIARTRIRVPSLRAQAWFVSTFFFPVLLKAVFEDKARQEQVVLESGLDWVLVRPSHLTDADPRPRIAVETDFRTPVGWSIPRANVARFMLDQLRDDRFVRAKPSIGS